MVHTTWRNNPTPPDLVLRGFSLCIPLHCGEVVEYIILVTVVGSRNWRLGWWGGGFFFFFFLPLDVMNDHFDGGGMEGSY